MYILSRFFVPYEDDIVEFKVKVSSGNQAYSYICWYKVYGYWRFKSSFFWKKIGLVYEKSDRGKFTPQIEKEMMPKFLLLSEQMFIEKLTGNYQSWKRSSISVRELTRRLEGDLASPTAPEPHRPATIATWFASGSTTSSKPMWFTSASSNINT